MKLSKAQQEVVNKMREQEMRKCMKEIKRQVSLLKARGYTLSDRDSTICLFDQKMFPGHPIDWTDEQTTASIVDSL